MLSRGFNLPLFEAFCYKVGKLNSPSHIIIQGPKRRHHLWGEGRGEGRGCVGGCYLLTDVSRGKKAHSKLLGKGGSRDNFCLG